MRSLLFALISVHLCSAVALSAEPPTPKFEPQTIDGTIRIGYGVAIGEVDGDGKPDILLADARQIVWYQNPGEPGKPWAKHIMAENLTQRDNVCIAARDINGDGKVEVAVGSNWNPGNTTDVEQSGAVFYLIRPDDPTQKWEAVKIEPHEPTVHRMRWVRVGDEKTFQLAVLPLHGVGNTNGDGKPVNLLMYETPDDPKGEWKLTRVETGLHATHNFTTLPHEAPFPEELVIAGKEGFVNVDQPGQGWKTKRVPPDGSPGEVAYAMYDEMAIAAFVEPMHGNSVVTMMGRIRGARPERRVIDDTLSQGHAIKVLAMPGSPYLAVVAGWRMPNKDKKVGIKMYVPLDDAGTKWATHVIDDNKMACEDIAVADLDGDGKLDLVAAGRATKNVIVYWNRTEMGE